jgi:hypothetical protein
VTGWIHVEGRLPIPAHAAALCEGGAEFLTAAFRASGAVGADNRVTRITQFDEVRGGSTGRKLLLAVEYEKDIAGLHRELFVKFSRDFDDPIRDRGRTQMADEVRFAQLSRAPGFPVAVPACYYADYDVVSGTGVLISERIAYGRNGIEPQYGKCLDHLMPAPLEHYEALLRSVARLAGTHQAGRLPAQLCEGFSSDAAVAERAPYSARQLQNRVSRLAEFAQRYPDLLPPNVRSTEFLDRLREDVVRFAAHEPVIRAALSGNHARTALCHWNANVDNAWFWLNADGRIECGLMDWGCVGPMNLAMAIWGAMSGAGTRLWDDHLEHLLTLFAVEFEAAGGAPVDIAALTQELMLYAAIMGMNWLLDTPAYIESLVPELAQAQDRFDPRIQDNEAARASLQMMTNVLNLWQTRDFGRLLAGFAG